MKSILINLYDFKEENISILKESKASRSGILTGLEDLTQKSQPGDIAFFYYSGHGSEVKNSLSTRQEGFFDEAIVPADAINGAKYIRDKELGVIFNKILDKGALLTVVFDCCHSGSLSRGIPSIDPPVTKSLPMDTADVKDPSVIPSPASRGALVIAASLPTQSANQLKSGELSLFTDAFIRSLREAGPNAPISDVVSRAAAIIKYQGEKPQIPNIDTDCPSSRTKAGLLGEPAGKYPDKMLVAVNPVDSRTGILELNGGMALGILAGSQFRHIKKPGVIIEITKLGGITLSEAKVISGLATDIQAGDLFELINWGIPDRPSLYVDIPSDKLSYYGM